MRLTFYRMLWLLRVLATVTVAALPLRAALAEAARAEAVPVYLYWSAGCPHCANAKAFLETLAADDPTIELRAFELGTQAVYDRAFVALSEHYGIEPPAVPLIAIGDRVIVGFGSGETTGAELREAIAACRRGCPDAVAAIARQTETGAGSPAPRQARAGAVQRSAIPETVWLPFVGEIETRALSLPALTIVLGLVDGFNPCAMWVLVFLIGLLVGMRDSVRMWSYGAVFLLTSALVYVAFMAAWLNTLMLLGSLTAIRMGIGLFAIAAGGYYLWQFWSNPDAACRVASPGERQHVMTRLKEAMAERSFLAAIAGIVVLAAVVNLIELLCSAGVPAVYTQVLALSDLSGPAYAGYLLLYISVFLIDDIIVFVTAMLTLQAAGLAATYSRYSHLIGGIVLGGIGLMLLLRPQWLAFA